MQVLEVVLGKPMSFAKALSLVPEGTKKHVLLGNGFSRACREDIFSYDALFDSADFARLSGNAKRAFGVLGTTDFEAVMRALQTTAMLIGLYSNKDRTLKIQLEEDALGLRGVLAETIAKNHPSRPRDISSAEYASCRGFLNNFDNIYTVNYDLLLYWALMHEELEPRVKADDGFRTPDGGPSEYVTWDIEKSNSQNVFYLHGSLHVFDAGAELKKFTWINTGVPLVDQIRSALSDNLFPLIVAESTSDRKLDRIQHSSFLSRAYRSFFSIGGVLFVFGHSMSSKDEHLLRLIEKGKTSHMLVGLFGDSESVNNKRIVQRCQVIKNKRSSKKSLEVTFFQAESASVWR